MTLSELQALPKREVDAMVAEQIFGMCPHPVSECGGYEKKEDGGWWIEYVDEYQGKCWKCGDKGVQWEARHGDFACLHYTTFAAHDYYVLQHVREKWDQSQRSAFADELFNIWRNRKGCNVGVLYEAMRYAPGDYSLAALLSLEAKGCPGAPTESKNHA